jgi:succinate dehydrogenase / fumarate reductase iron-sulfur subunit
MQVTFRILRYNPEKDNEPHFEEYTIEAFENMTVLDCLHKIKWELDGTLSFRRSCAHGVCGSDGIRINGKNRLACSLLKDINFRKR